MSLPPHTERRTRQLTTGFGTEVHQIWHRGEFVVERLSAISDEEATEHVAVFLAKKKAAAEADPGKAAKERFEQREQERRQG